MWAQRVNLRSQSCIPTTTNGCHVEAVPYYVPGCWCVKLSQESRMGGIQSRLLCPRPRPRHPTMSQSSGQYEVPPCPLVPEEEKGNSTTVHLPGTWYRT